MGNNIQTAYDQVKKFNAIAGNLQHYGNDADLDSIANQIEFIKEELDETFEAFTNQDAVGLVDGANDLFVTVAGLMQKLEANGVNIEKALARVCANNLTKFPSEFEYRQNPDLCPEGAVANSTPYGHVVFKREIDDKVMKPTNFVPVDLVSCVPEDFFGTSNTEEA